MNLSKLGLQRTHPIFHLWKTEVTYHKIMKTVDRASFEETKRRCQQMNLGGRPGKKYLRSGLYIRENINRALMLGLHRSGQQLRILDLGCGPGYFAWVCRFLGHDVMGIDLPGNELYNELLKFLDVPRRDYRIWAFEPLPRDIGNYDLITGFSTNFNRHGAGGEYWAKPEWEFFLQDMHGRLAANGKLYLRLNLNWKNSAQSSQTIANLLATDGFRTDAFDRRSIRFERVTP